jgi:hypothetical protein
MEEANYNASGVIFKEIMEEIKYINHRKHILSTCVVCGKRFYTRADNIKRGIGRSCSLKCNGKLGHKALKTKCGGSVSGKNNPNWKGGISKNYYHYKKLQIQRYPERVEARRKLGRAVKQGKIKRGKCQICGKENAHAHHKDYSKPLDVEWFCRTCHRKHKHDSKH